MSRILSDMLVFLSFLVAVNKTTRQSNLKKGRFILAHTHLNRKDVIVGVWGHNAPTFRKCEMLPTFMVDLSISVTPIWNHPHRPTQRNISTVIINPTKWMPRLTTTLHQHYFPSITLMRSYWNSPYAIWLEKYITLHQR